MESQVRKLDKLGWTQFICHFVCFFCLIKRSYEHFATCTHVVLELSRANDHVVCSYTRVWANTSNNRLYRLTNGALPTET